MLVAAFLAMPVARGITLAAHGHAEASLQADVEKAEASQNADVEHHAKASHCCCDHNVSAVKSIQECCVVAIMAEAARALPAADFRAQSLPRPETRDGIDHRPLRRPPRGIA